MDWTAASPAPRRIIPTPTPTRIPGITWNEAQFKEYIKDPKAKIPGTKMAFAGIKNEKEVNDLWAFSRNTTRTERPSNRPATQRHCYSFSSARRLGLFDGFVVRQEGVRITSGPAALAIRATVSVMAGAPDV